MGMQFFLERERNYDWMKEVKKEQRMIERERERVWFLSFLECG